MRFAASVALVVLTLSILVTTPDESYRVALGGGYVARVDRKGIRIEKDGSHLRYTLESVSAGGRELKTEEGTVRLFQQGDRVVLDHGAFQEEYRREFRGMEQYFVAPRPLPAGDWVVTGRLDSDLPATREDQGIVFRRGGEVLLGYSHGLVKDAAGRETPVKAEYAAGHVTLRVEGAWMNSATYPVVLDPLLGNLMTMSGSTSIAGWSLPRACDVVYNPTTDDFFSVFSAIPSGGNNNNLYASIVDQPASAAGLPGSVLTLDSSTNNTIGVSAAWNPAANAYLVAFSSSVDQTAKGYEIYGLFVGSNGSPIGGGTPFNISAGTVATISDSAPDVACDGTNWLVTWTASDTAGGDILARVVNKSTGNTAPTFGGNVISVQVDADNNRFSSVAWNGSTYLVVWENRTSNNGMGAIQGKAVSAAGAAGSLISYDAATPDWTRENPDVAGNTTQKNFLVTWDEFDNNSPSGAGDPMMRLTGENGTPAKAAESIDPDPNTEVDGLQTSVAWNAAKNLYFVTWMDNNATSPTYEVQGALVYGWDGTNWQGNIAIANPQYSLFFTTPQGQNIAIFSVRATANAASTNGTAAICQWIKITNGTTSFPIQAQRFDLPTPPVAPPPPPGVGGSQQVFGSNRENKNGDGSINDNLCSAGAVSGPSSYGMAVAGLLLIAGLGFLLRRGR